MQESISGNPVEIEDEGARLKLSIIRVDFNGVLGRIVGNSDSTIYVSDNGKGGILLVMNAQLTGSATTHTQSQNTDEEQENQDD